MYVFESIEKIGQLDFPENKEKKKKYQSDPGRDVYSLTMIQRWYNLIQKSHIGKAQRHRAFCNSKPATI